MKRDRSGRYGEELYRDKLSEAKSMGERMGDNGRPAAPCMSCGERPRELPYMKCHTCRMPLLRAASQKGWRTIKRMRRMRAQDD